MLTSRDYFNGILLLIIMMMVLCGCIAWIMSALKKEVSETKDILLSQSTTKLQSLTDATLASVESLNIIRDRFLEMQTSQQRFSREILHEIALMREEVNRKSSDLNTRFTNGAALDAIDILIKNMNDIKQEMFSEVLPKLVVLWKETTQIEWEQLKTSLTDLSHQLNVASTNLTQGSHGFKDDVVSVGTDLVAKTQLIEQKLTSSAAALDSAASSIKRALNDAQVTLGDLSSQSNQSAKFVVDTLEKSEHTLANLLGISEHIARSSASFETITNRFTEVVTNVDDIAQRQMTVADAVREAGPHAQAAVERLAVVLEAAGAHTQASIEATAITMDQTVSNITTGISEYSNQVSELHRKMDESLGKAVASFHLHVSDLSDSVQELSEIMRHGKNA